MKLTEILTDYTLQKCNIKTDENKIYTITPHYGLRNMVFDTLTQHKDVEILEILKRDTFNKPSKFTFIIKQGVEKC